MVDLLCEHLHMESIEHRIKKTDKASDWQGSYLDGDISPAK